MADICILSLEEAGRLEHWGIWPKCKNHPHMKKQKALALVADETHRFVGGPDTEITDVGSISMIVPTDCTRMWAPVACHFADGSKAMGMRTWGNKAIA